MWSEAGSRSGPSRPFADRDAVRELTGLLEQEARALDDVYRGQHRSRLAFVARRGDELQAALLALQPAADALRELEQRRAAAAAKVGEARAPVSELLPRVPADLRPALAAAAERVRHAAHRVRLESSVGQRLLEFAGRAHEAMLQALLRGSELRAYDRHARAIVHGRNHHGPTGGLVSGRA